MHLAFITVKESPLQDSRVRRALNFAVNRPLIVATILRGATVPASQAIPRQAFGYDPALSPYPYDPAAAKALLAKIPAARGPVASGVRRCSAGLELAGPNPDSAVRRRRANFNELKNTLSSRASPSRYGLVAMTSA